jgi:hypothetical protein
MFTTTAKKQTFPCDKLCELSERVCAFLLIEKKIAMNLKELSKRLANSSKTPTSISEVIDHLRLLAKHVPDWCTICDISGTEYFRLIACDIWEAVRNISTVQKHLRS